MKKFFKILGICLGIICALILIAIATIFIKLPLPTSFKPTVSSTANAKKYALPAAQQTTASKQTLDTTESSQDHEKSKISSRDIFENLMDPKQNVSQVCLSLKNFKKTPENFKYSEKLMTEHMMEGLFAPPGERDPVIMAVMTPLRFFLQKPKVRDLVKLVDEQIQKGGADSVKAKVEFYSLAYDAATEMYENKKSAEELIDRSYYFYMMTKALQLRPELAQDERVFEYCQSIEKAINAAVPVDSEKEKSEFERFLEVSEIDRAKIGYDPEYKTELTFKNEDASLQFQGGWLEEVFSKKNEQ